MGYVRPGKYDGFEVCDLGGGAIAIKTAKGEVSFSANGDVFVPEKMTEGAKPVEPRKEVDDGTQPEGTGTQAGPEAESEPEAPVAAAPEENNWTRERRNR